MPDLVVPGLVPDLVPDYTTSPLQVEKKEIVYKEKLRREKAMKQNTKVIVRFHSARLCLFKLQTSLLRRLHAQTLPDAASPIGKVHPFSKIAVTLEPVMRF